MAENIYNLYPQYNDDRRKQSSAVDTDRRSNADKAVPPINNSIKQDISKTQAEINEMKKQGNFFINQVNKYDSFTKQNQIKKDSKAEEVKKDVFAVLSPIPYVRRFAGIDDNTEKGDYVKAATLLGLAVANLPEDTRDIKSSFKQIIKGQKTDYDYKEFQHPFSFFRGTFLEPLTKKCKKLYDMDKTLFDTKAGQKIADLLKVEAEDCISTGKFNCHGIEIIATKLSGKFLNKLICRGMLRVPVVGLAIAGLLELPSIIKAATSKDNKAKNTLKQVLKSTASVLTTTSMIAITGALFARKGPIGSLVGIGIGSVIGTSASKQLSNMIDNADKTTS